MAESLEPLSEQRTENNQMAEDNDYLKLRQLLLGNDYDSALQRYISKEEDAERVAKVLAYAVELSRQQDNALGEALAPVVDQAIGNSIESNPKRITNIIFPVMGPAIRKAVSSALTEMVQSLNTLLEQSLTFNSLKWRFNAWRSGVPYAQYVLLQTIEFRVEQVFLVHRETGLLLNSVTAKEVSAQDPELVSSMLTAITDFVSDSFTDSSKQGEGHDTLERIRFGQLELLLYSGPEATLALAVRGSATDELNLKAHRIIETLHLRFAKALARFDGDRAPFEETDELLSECLISQKVAPVAKKKPWLAIVAILIACAFWANYEYERYQFERLLTQIEQRFKTENSYVVIEFERHENGAKVELIRSPESKLPSILLEELELKTSNGTSVDISVFDTVVHFGPLPEPPKPRPLTEHEKYAKLVANIESHTFYFAPKAIQLSPSELEKVPHMIRDLKSLEEMIHLPGQSNLQLSIIGFADNQGSEYGNKTVSQKRANYLRDLLLENGVPSGFIVAWGVGNIDLSTTEERHQRRVNIVVTPKRLEDERQDNGVLK